MEPTYDLSYTPVAWRHSVDDNIPGVTSPPVVAPKVTLLDKIKNVLGVAEKGVGVWDSIQNPKPKVDPTVVPEAKFLGMPMALGVTVTMIGVLVTGIIIYKVAK